MDELLEAQYASGSLGNLEDPLDELIYIILSIQTKPNGYQTVFGALKSRFPKWEGLLTVSESEVEEIIRPAGLSRQKARHIRAIVDRVWQEARERAGDLAASANLDFLATEPDSATEAFLVSLQGVSVKTARCVMMYALGRDVFPVDTHIYRILTRMGIADVVHRKLAGDPMQSLVPAKIRQRLHVNLIHHGRAICTPQSPQCARCPLISFCETGLQHHRARPKVRPVAVDVFAGPGGLSVGFRRGGYSVVFAADLDRNAAQTYRWNHPGVPTFETDVALLKGSDILDIAGLPDIDVLVGGPPCQGYSQAGKRDPSHPYNHLYRHFARLGKELAARLLVMENVPGIRNVNGKAFVGEIKAYFSRQGLRCLDVLLNAAAFGVAQSRQRLLFLAAPKDSTVASMLCAPPARFGVPNGVRGVVSQTDGVLPRARTVGDVIGGLPSRRAGEGLEVDEWSGRPLYNHVAMNHSPAVVAKIGGIRAGEGPISYRRLDSEEPARTIIAGHRAMPVHPVEDRTITAREAARLQSFEDDFRFLGPRAEHPLQIANAVPPLLSQAVAEHARPWLDTKEVVKPAAGPLLASATAIEAPPR